MINILYSRLTMISPLADRQNCYPDHISQLVSFRELLID